MKPLSFENTEIAFQSKSTKQLNKSYWLFKLVSNNTLVKVSPFLLKIAFALRLPIKGLIKQTIFEQFCGGESIDKCDRRIQSLAKYNIGTILDYSVEGKSSEDDFNRVTQETIRTILKAKENDNIPFAVFKTSGLARIELLEKVSNSKIELNKEEKEEFKRVKERINSICATAHKNNVRLFIDAEESWIQDAVDHLIEELMEKFNRNNAIVFNTLQMYRHDRMNYLKKLHEKALQKNFHIGLKIVRGAYMEKERERAKEFNYPSPICVDKKATDDNFNTAIKYMMNHTNMELFAGTHNEESSYLLMDLVKKHHLKPNDRRLWFGQLFGMSDHISFNLAKEGYNTAKYVPFGPVRDVMPYLIRRAEENTSVAGQTNRELNLIKEERIRRKLS